MQKKKMPVFWKFYIGYMFLLITAVIVLLTVLWRFLDTFENTRPIHAMKKAITLIEDNEREELLGYMTTADNEYESADVIVDALLKRVQGRSLSFGRLSGKYTERHPVYAVTADDETIATFAFVEKEEEEKFHLHGWEIEAITVCSNSQKSVAITVPQSVNVYINNVPVKEEHIIRTSESGMPVEYVDYKIEGLIEEPSVTATDRYEQPLTLSRDENGAYYYQMSFVAVPDGMVATVNGKTIPEENLIGEEPYEELSFIAQLEKELPEYEHLSEMITIPQYRKYLIDYEFQPNDLVLADELGTKIELEYDENTRTYRTQPVSGNRCYDEATTFAMSFLKDYTLFCSNDQELDSIAKYFPQNSQYLELISHLNNNSFIRHTDTTLKNQRVDDYFEYSENLVYVHVTVDEWMHLTRLDYDKVYRVELPVWIVKIDGKWYVAKIDYENFKQL